MDIAELVRTLIALQTRIYELTDDDRRPVPHPPIDSASLAALERWFAARAAVLPPSYRAFLRVCDGIDDFSFSYHLFGSRFLLSPEYDAIAERALGGGASGLERASADELILIGRHPDTRTRLILDPHHAPLEPGETVVFDGDPGFLSLHASFGSFLEMSVQAAKLTIRTLEQQNRGVPDDEP